MRLESFLLEISSSVRALYLWQRSHGGRYNFIERGPNWAQIVLEMFAQRLDALAIDNLKNSDRTSYLPAADVATLFDVRFSYFSQNPSLSNSLSFRNCLCSASRYGSKRD